MHWLGLSSMPRRIVDYPSAFAGWNLVCSYGSYVSVVSLFVFFIVITDAMVNAKISDSNPWPNSERVGPEYSLEWLLQSPMDFHSHAELPVIRKVRKPIEI